MQVPAGLDKARGTFVGLVIGDAAGVPLEFSHVTRTSVEEALRFPGGGVWRVGRYQVCTRLVFDVTTELADLYGFLLHAAGLR